MMTGEQSRNLGQHGGIRQPDPLLLLHALHPHQEVQGDTNSFADELIQ